MFLPLGGAGEIGLNAYLYGIGPEDDRKWLLVDLGISFADEREPGVDIILPDISYLEAERGALAGLVLTHAHEDHYGALAHLWPRLQCPVYATPFSTHLLKGRLIEHGLHEDVPVHEITVGGRFDVGPFDVEFVAMTHSIPEPMALFIRTPLGNILHSGDWKIDDDPVLGDRINSEEIKALGVEGCRALICDSTNVLRDGLSVSEGDVARGLEEVIATAPKRVAVTTFASNLGRVIAIARAAEKSGRTVVGVGRAIWRIIDAGRAAGYMNDVPPILDMDAFDALARENVLCLCTGSQGESRAALARIAEGSHPAVSFDPGDLVIFSSRTIPGNEKAVAVLTNNLSRMGVDIITDDDHLVHSSGHPRRDELRQLYEWIDPELVVPMHGEARHLRAQCKFVTQTTKAQAVLAENGDIARLAPDPPGIIDQAPSGRLHLDGRLIVPAHNGPARDRRRLSYAGLIAVSLLCDKKGRLVDDPKIALFGLPDVEQSDVDFEQIVLDAVETAVQSVKKEKVNLQELVRQVVRRRVDMAWGKKPICKVFVHVA